VELHHLTKYLSAKLRVYFLTRPKLVHATLEQRFRLLGNLTPRAAARTKSGREKLVVWLKHLENRSRQPEATDPMATYDFAWLWRELKVEHLRR
jgi:hypothetical protein